VESDAEGEIVALTSPIFFIIIIMNVIYQQDDTCCGAAYGTYPCLPFLLLKLGKKGYVQLQTSLGNLNLEIHCDICPCTAWNFITLCLREYYDNMTFHRLVPGFMIQCE